MEETTVLPFFIVKNQKSTAANMRRIKGSSELRNLDVAYGLSEISYASRNSILELASAEDRVHIAQAISSLRYKFQSQKKLDLTYRAIDGHLLLELLNCTGCQAAHTKFPFGLDMLCDLKILRGCSSTVTALDLTGASISPPTLQELLDLCPQLECLSLGGLQVSEDVFTLKKGLGDLQVLNLNGCAGLGKIACVHALFKAAPNVINLDIGLSDITAEGLTYMVANIRDKLEVLCVAELGQRFTEDHLQTLVTRCVELIHLDLQSTLAVHQMNPSHYALLPRLEILIASMLKGVNSVINAETLLSFEALPALKKLVIRRRITDEEVQRFAPWNLKFAVVRSDKYPSLEDAADVVCRDLTAEAGSEYPKMQMSLRMQHAGSDPL